MEKAKSFRENIRIQEKLTIHFCLLIFLNPVLMGDRFIHSMKKEVANTPTRIYQLWPPIEIWENSGTRATGLRASVKNGVMAVNIIGVHLPHMNTTFFIKNATIRPPIIIDIRNSMGTKKRNTPSIVPTPFPPLNLCQTGLQ